MNSCQSSSLCGFVVKNLVDVCHKQRLCFQFEDVSSEVQLRDPFASLWPCGRMAGFQGSYWVWPCPCTSLNFVEQVLDVHLEAWVGFWNFKKLETYQSQIRSFQEKGTFCPITFRLLPSRGAGIESSKPILKEGRGTKKWHLLAVSERLGCGVSALWTN